MSKGTPLHHGFTASIPQSDADIAEALRTGLLSLDANVLLDFYRYGPTARGALLSVLRVVGDRAWVSHQAATEFWRNRCRTIDDRNQATEELKKNIAKRETDAIGDVDTWAKKTAVPDEVKQQIKRAVAAGFTDARELIDTELRGVGTISYDPAKDSVLTQLTELLAQHVGGPFPEDEHKKAIEEGARRIEARIPPGFRDAKKVDGDGPDGGSGDYLVWLQSMAESCRRDVPLVIVTSDEKEDWWWKHRSVFMGPRQELVEEFAQRSQRRLYMLRPVQLIDHAAVLEVSVPEGAASDMARADIAEQSGHWTKEAVAELLRRLDLEGWEQSEIIRFAAAQGGIIERAKIYEIADYEDSRQLRGFTRPSARITSQLQDEGILERDVEPILTPFYAGGNLADRFEVPLDVVEIISASPELA